MVKLSEKILWLSTVYIFIVLPFAYLPITQDPEITLRYGMLSVLIAIITAYYAFLGGGKVVFIKATSLFLAFAGYVLVSGTALAKSFNTGDGVFEFLKLVTCFGLFIILSETIKKAPQMVERMSTLIMAGTFIFLAWGLIQMLFLTPQIRLEGLSFAVINRITSSLSNKNFFSETLMMTLPFSIYSMTNGNKTVRYMSLLTTILSLLLIGMLQSINVYIALVFFIIILFFSYVVWIVKSDFPPFNNPRYRVIRITFILGIAFLTLFSAGIIFKKSDSAYFSTKLSTLKSYAASPSTIFELNDADNNSSLYDRLFLARNSLLMFKENPFTGNGIANWQILLPKYGMVGNTIMSTGRIRFEHPHNEYLFILCESGLVGLTLWILVLALALFSIFKVIRRIYDPKKKFFMSLMAGGIMAFILMSLFSYPKERFFTMIVLMVILAIVNSGIEESKWTFFINKKLLIILLAISISITGIFIIRYRSEVLLYSAFKAQKSGNFRKMKLQLEKAQTPFHILDLTSTPLNWHLGQSHYYQGNHSAAFKHYLLASQENPYHMQALNDLGALYEARCDHQNAIACFNRVFAINPQFSDSRWNMIAVYFNMGEIEKAYQLIKDVKPRYTDKWRSDMNMILLAKAEMLVQANRDTQLADYLNERIAKQPHFLIDELIRSEKDSISFEEHLTKSKLSDN